MTLITMLLLPLARTADGQAEVIKPTFLKGLSLGPAFIGFLLSFIDLTMKYRSNKIYPKDPLNSIHISPYDKLLAIYFPPWFYSLPPYPLLQYHEELKIARCSSPLPV